MRTDSVGDITPTQAPITSSEYLFTVTLMRVQLEAGGETIVLQEQDSSCPDCNQSDVVAPPTIALGDTVTSDTLQALFTGSRALAPADGAVYTALQSGGTATVRYTVAAEGEFDANANFTATVNTESQATVSCTTLPDEPPEIPPVPAIGPIGLAALSFGLAGAGGLLGFRRRP
jgi:hypothetical protein